MDAHNQAANVLRAACARWRDIADRKQKVTIDPRQARELAKNLGAIIRSFDETAEVAKRVLASNTAEAAILSDWGTRLAAYADTIAGTDAGTADIVRALAGEVNRMAEARLPGG